MSGVHPRNKRLKELKNAALQRPTWWWTEQWKDVEVEKGSGREHKRTTSALVGIMTIPESHLTLSCTDNMTGNPESVCTRQSLSSSKSRECQHILMETDSEGKAQAYNRQAGEQPSSQVLHYNDVEGKCQE